MSRVVWVGACSGAGQRLSEPGFPSRFSPGDLPVIKVDPQSPEVVCSHAGHFTWGETKAERSFLE